MDTNKMIDILIKNEGIRGKPYRCPAKKLTIGIGRNLDDKGITDHEALYLCKNDILECYNDLEKIFPGWASFSDDRHHALIDMRFNLGLAGFLTFKKMIAAIKKEDWATAAIEAKDSKWFGQVQHSRKHRVISSLLGGNPPA